MSAAAATSTNGAPDAEDDDAEGPMAPVRRVVAAAMAAVAAVVGLESEIYAEIDRRLPEELRRRHIDG
jgi:hypothetical protein